MRQTGKIGLGIVTAGLIFAAGCSSQNKPAKITCNAPAPGCPKTLVVFSPPVTDEMMQTPSTEYINQSRAEGIINQRAWPASNSYYSPQVVEHLPVYFEDPFESVGSPVDPCNQGWTWVDWFDIGYSDARWLANTVALPVSMVFNPAVAGDVQQRRADPPAVGWQGRLFRCEQPVPEPFDLKCPQQQVDAMAAVGGETPVVVEANPPVVPATLPAR